MAEVVRFGEPENESERMAIAYLHSHLPSSYKLFTNLEIKQGVEIFELDLILLAPHCVYVVDVKNWHGRIEIVDPKWYPDNYQCFPSPLKKLRKHAKVVSSTICDMNRAREQDLSKVHIQATVLMAADDVVESVAGIIPRTSHLDPCVPVSGYTAPDSIRLCLLLMWK